MNVKQFALPDVGEGLTEADIVTWLIKPGDTVTVNQAIVEIETAKSLVELPCPYAGEVAALHAEPGETVDVGSPIVSISTADAEPLPGPQKPAEPAQPPMPQTDEDPKLLVGYGAREISSQRRRRRFAAPAHPQTEASRTAEAGPPKATPPVRKLAKDLGLDLAAITATGTGGIRTRDDVLKAASTRPLQPAAGTVPSAGDAGNGEIRIPIKGVRKHTAAAMVQSAFTAPHVTEFITVDVSRTVELQKEISSRRDFKDIKLTPLTFVAKAFLRAIQRTPEANSRWDDAAQEIVQSRDINLGIAAATPRGLIVPNIKGAQNLPLRDLATGISQLATAAREGKTEHSAMTNGTVTITNIGVFGIDTGTPILNPGETAILAVGTIRRTPWVINDDRGERIEPRSVMQLALSFDHRVMDGQQGSQLLADTAEFLREPGLAVL